MCTHLSPKTISWRTIALVEHAQHQWYAWVREDILRNRLNLEPALVLEVASTRKKILLVDIMHKTQIDVKTYLFNERQEFWWHVSISEILNFELRTKLRIIFLGLRKIWYPYQNCDRLCLVVRVVGYRSRGPGSITDTSRFSEKYWVWNGVHSASWVQLRSYLKEIVAVPV
jgi:hypothetical protein